MSTLEALTELINQIKGQPEGSNAPTDFNLDELARPGSMYAMAKEFKNSVPDPSMPDLVDASKLRKTQKLAILYAIRYSRYKNDNTIEQQAHVIDEGDAGSNNTPTTIRDAGANPATFDPYTRRGSGVVTNQCIHAPTGSGKTLIALYLMILEGHNALFMTNNFDNALQTYNAIVTHTNFTRYFGLHIIQLNKQNINQQQKSGIDQNHFIKDNSEFNCKLKGFDMVYGIVIIDTNQFKELKEGTADRTDTRRAIFKDVRWDSFVVDEADISFTETVSRAFLNGLKEDGVYYKLQYNNGVYLSGTFYKSDKWWKPEMMPELGKISFTIRSRDLEMQANPPIAKLAVCLVQTGTENETSKQAAMNRLEICERIVRVHTMYRHKIMIFATRKKNVLMLQRLFPSALIVMGTDNKNEKAGGQADFKQAANSPDQAGNMLLITTSIGSEGFDVQDLDVVINYENNGESATQLRQRMGRASRRLRGTKERGWFYDLVIPQLPPKKYCTAGSNPSSSEKNPPSWKTKFASDPPPPPTRIDYLFEHAQRYKLIKRDGYVEEDSSVFLRTKQALENELRELLETGLALADNRVSSDYEFWVDLMIKYESVVDSTVNNLLFFDQAYLQTAQALTDYQKIGKKAFNETPPDFKSKLQECEGLNANGVRMEPGG